MIWVLREWKRLSIPERGLRHEIEGAMMKPTVWLLLFLFLLGGCAITYTHPTKSLNDFEKDKRECELIARKTLAAKGIPDT
jgi:hypothetical protein